MDADLELNYLPRNLDGTGCRNLDLAGIGEHDGMVQRSRALSTRNGATTILRVYFEKHSLTEPDHVPARRYHRSTAPNAGVPAAPRLWIEESIKRRNFLRPGNFRRRHLSKTVPMYIISSAQFWELRRIAEATGGYGRIAIAETTLVRSFMRKLGARPSQRFQWPISC